MTAPGSPSLVDGDWLARRLDDAAVRVVDASWYLPNLGRSARAEYEACRIPGAAFWDIDAVADPDSGLPHMLPDAATFARHMQALGIGDDTMVVLYDAPGLVTAARPWWMLRCFGHDRVAILDGGLRKWRAEGRKLDTAPPAPEPPREARVTPRPRPEMVRSIEHMRRNLDSRSEQVLDARSAGRFSGTDAEPRPECRPGHIPGALSLPCDRLIDAETGCVLPPERLRAAFEAAGVDLGRPVTTSCGSGVTACVLAFGLHLLDHEAVAVYDGSWSEWGARADTPVET